MMGNCSLTSEAKTFNLSSFNGIYTHTFIHFNYLIMIRGIQEGQNLLLAKYRFNQPFHLIGADNFLKDLFNDKNLLSTFHPVAATLSCSGVKYKKMNSSVINMSFFDVLKEK